jgi:UDP-N-acetylmuramoylalanine--D-glutamate ligase
MIPLSHYAGKKVAVLGLGKSGNAAAAALRNSGADVVVWDDKATSTEGEALTHYEDWDWAHLALIVMSPGIALTHPTPHPVVALAQQHNVRLTCDISLLMEACEQATYIGITGTNGKSTTTALIAHTLRELGATVQCGGNIGVPVLGMQPFGESEVYVLELSSYQLDLMDAGRLNVACLLNITPDHLDRHGDMQGYITAKKRLFLRQTAHDTAIIAVDDDHTRAIADAMPRAVRVSAFRQSGSEFYMECGELVDASTIPEQHYDMALIATLGGAHNHQNALVAFAACRRMGYSADAIFEAMQSFEGLSHRMERVAVIDHVLFINDSKATNADAAEKSMTSFDNLYWIIGGVPKSGGITSLAPHFGRVKQAYCIGEAAEAFAATLAEHHVPHQLCGTLDVAVRQAFTDGRGQQDAVVLFAPACASFDQFANFEARGDAFKALVAALS